MIADRLSSLRFPSMIRLGSQWVCAADARHLVRLAGGGELDSYAFYQGR